MKSELGRSSAGTIVYKGKLGDREIAIKRFKKMPLSNIEKEISVLLMTHSHPNILLYYAKEVDERYFFIGAEMCEYNLATFKTSNSWRQKMSINKILLQSVKGLKHLHKHNISN